MTSPEIPEGCSQEMFAQIREEYCDNPRNYAKRFQRLLVHDAEKTSAKSILHADAANTQKWLYWLDYLAESSFHGWSAPYQPEVKIIHGMKDAVIPSAQAKYWSRIFPQVQVMLLPEMAHALTQNAIEIIITEFNA
jgi:pimeloyl-ACP methyl ester carboxylesterase